MRTPVDEEIHALGRQTGHEDPVRRHVALVRLTELVTACPPSDDVERDVLAGLLPTALTGPPEADLLLAGLYERLGDRLTGRPRPQWRTAGHLPATVRIAWLRADVLHDPGILREEAPDEILHQAVRGMSITAALRPDRLVDELADTGDPVLRAEALRLAREGLHAGLVAPAAVREKLIALLAADSVPVVAGALGELAEPWAATAPLPPALLAPFFFPRPVRERTGEVPEGSVPQQAGLPAEDAVRERPAVAGAALTAAARHGHRELLRGVVEDPRQAPGLRRRGMELLGELADRDDIGDLIAVAAGDPLLLGGPAVVCLRGLHRRGHFPHDPQVHALVGLALSDHSIPARDVATILFTSRHEALRVLTDAPAADPGWPRRLELLVALAGQGTGDLPVGDVITRLLPSAPEPVPFLGAIRALRHTDAEEAVLALLSAAPDAALDTLEAIGGDRTVRVLAEGLGLTTGVTAPHLRPVRGRALELLWQLNRDPDRRRALLDRLDPVDLPPRVAAGLGGPDAAELALLTSHLDPDAPVEALCRLAAHGDAATLPAITDLLSRVVAGLAASRRPDAAPRTGEHGQPAGEPAVPQEVLDALSALGRRLHERGAIRPVCLLGVEAENAGHALVASTALDLVDRPGLSDDEHVVLLELLLRAPWSGTRARVHRLLRHRDRHVRGHVIALLAHDATGEDTQALSASLIALTRAKDIQTVRQALLALGHARAHWASAAVAACLGHPNMNIRKTAAEALVRAGAPAALPELLSRLGQESNPALRASLVAALRAVLGDAYAATLVAAAEHSRDEATGRLLLGLHGVLTARSVRALDEQESPVAIPLLTLVGSRHVALAAGVVTDLAPAMAAHGITLRPAAPWEVSGEAERDVEALATGGWDPRTALRLVARGERLGFAQADRLGPLLADWLALAGSQDAAAQDAAAQDTAAQGRAAQYAAAQDTAAHGRARGAEVLRFALALCSRPRSGPDLTALARSAPLLLDALADARDAHRNTLIAVLEEVAPLLTATAKPAAVTAVRALAPAPATPDRSTLTLLRRLGAIPVRADLDRALAEARLGADPGRAATAVLREAFAAPKPRRDAAPWSEAALAWRSALAGALGQPGTLAEFRRTDEGTVSSRDRLAALIEAHNGADAGARDALIDWMTRLQPLDAPPWTLAESARAPQPPPRRVRADDLDQPRSAALRERLLAMLGSAEAGRRQTAAEALAGWPEPEARPAVLRAYLNGRVSLPAVAVTGLGSALAGIGESELRGDGILRDRVAAVATGLDPQQRERLLPLLLEWWEHAPPAEAAALGTALRAHPADALAVALGDRLDAAAWGFLDLLVGRPLLRTPALTRTCRRLRAEGRDELADRLLLADGPLRGPDAGQRDAAALAALRDRDAARPAATGHRPTRRELMDLAATGAPEQICRALTGLAETHTGPEPDRDPRLRNLLGELLTHPRPRVRLRAHRTARAMLDRAAYLRHTELLLDDSRPDVVRMALRTLCRADWEPAVPAVTGLLGHPHATVRVAAAEALAELGGTAVPVLRHAAARARPDRRSLYTDILARIEADGH